jgi:hypothetical protein
MDSGKYECSVNTLPKISHVMELVVKDPMDIIMRDSPYTMKPPFTKPSNEMTVSDEVAQYPGPSALAVISGPATHHVSSGSTITAASKLPAVL